MPMLQRFYPSFFMSALRNSGILSPSVENTFKAALFDDGAVFDSNNSIIEDISSYRLEDSIRDVTINVSRDGFRVLFEVPEISWNLLPDSSFQNVVIYKIIAGKGSLLFMHIDLGSLLFPVGGNFTFTPDDACIPNIDFDYQVCI